MEKVIKKFKKEYKILAGEMPVVSGKVKPSSDKGELRFFQNADNMLCMEWRNLNKNTVSEPLVIFEDEWDWTKLETQKGRVFKLQSKTFPDEQYFYWMQYPNKAEDLLNEQTIRNILATGRLEIDMSSELNSVDAIMKNEEETDIKTDGIKNNNNTNNKSNSDSNPPLNNAQISSRGGSNNNSDFIKNLAKSFGKNKQKYPSLYKLLSKTNIVKNFDNKYIQELIKLLPDGQQNMEYFNENISCPQFQQALESLSNALNSENLPYILQSFGLDSQKGMTISPDGVEAFIKCIIEKFPKK